MGVALERIHVAVEAPSEIYRPSDSSADVAAAARRVDLPAGARWFTYVGGFNPHKHVDLLVRAHAAVAAQHADPPHLVLVGTVSDDVFHGDQGRIRATIRACETESLVHWAGFVPDEELAHLHSGALGLALPSACEGFGLPAVEAAACGTPVVATTESRCRSCSPAAASSSSPAPSSPARGAAAARRRRGRTPAPRRGGPGRGARALLGRRRRRRAARAAGGPGMRPLRFCHLTTFYPPHNFGGDGVGIQRLCRTLARRGHEVTVVHDSDAFFSLHSGPEPELAPEPEDSASMRFVRLRSKLGKASSLLTQQLGRPVVHAGEIRRLLEEDFDVINFHNISLVGGPGLLRCGNALKLYMAHEHWLVCPSHVLWRHGRELCTERECLRCVLSYRRPPQLWRYTNALAREGRHVDAFIAMSEFSRAKHREFGFPFDMEVLPYFLPDLPPAAQAPEAGPNDASPHERPYFLFVGRLEKIKGLDDVIPLFRDYTDADLLVAGDGEYADTLRALGRDLPRVKFLGRVPLDDLARYYRHAVALIVPSVCLRDLRHHPDRGLPPTHARDRAAHRPLPRDRRARRRGRALHHRRGAPGGHGAHPGQRAAARGAGAKRASGLPRVLV